MEHDLTAARKNARTEEDAAAIAWAQDEIERLRDKLVAISAYASPYRDGSFGALDRIAVLAGEALQPKMSN